MTAALTLAPLEEDRRLGAIGMAALEVTCAGEQTGTHGSVTEDSHREGVRNTDPEIWLNRAAG